MIATSIEQSKKLLDLGIDPKTADMSWVLIYDENHMMSDYRLDLIPCKFNSATCCPAWSLSALWELIREQGVSLSLRTRFSYDINVTSASCEDERTWRQFVAETPIDALVEVIEWLCKNDYMRKENKK